MEITTIGIDLAKSVFALSAADASGRVVTRTMLRRKQVLEFLRRCKPCLVGLEACGGAHHWARAISALGHEVKLMNPALVQPYRKGQKHDRNDADAVLEALTRPSMRFVAHKSVAQQDVLALHAVRTRTVRNRTALSNQIRALLHERGIVVERGAAALQRMLAQLPEDHPELSGATRELLGELSAELRQLELRVKLYDQRIARATREDERCMRLREVPGVGPLSASATVATLGNAREFKSGRELSAYLGLVPRQHSSGGKTVLRGISKHGNRQLRTLLIHGARAVLFGKHWRANPRAVWARRLMEKRGVNVAVVALANHTARVLWALLSRGDRYRAPSAVCRPAPSSAGAAVRRVRAENCL